MASHRSEVSAVGPSVPARSRAARLWSETWRLLVALMISLFALVVVVDEAFGGLTPRDELVVLDLLLGVLSFGLLLIRRRLPTTVALVIVSASAVSALAAGPVVLAIVSLSTHRRWWRIAAIGVVWLGAGYVFERVYPTVEDQSLIGDPTLDVALTLFLGAVMYGLLVWIGAYIGLRREHLSSLHERIAAAEREQSSRVAQARVNERARIAREMHDVLAHRMSLVAMHAGALAFRTDLPPEKVAETAALVRDSAHEALGELREVLGVLRGLDSPAPPVAGPDDEPLRPESPQPTLADFTELVAATTVAGVRVHVDAQVEQEDAIPRGVSRTAYRIVQEALTNVLKHAPESPATVVLRGAPGEGVAITVSNPTPASSTPLPVSAGAASRGMVSPPTGPPPSGLGLLGLAERAELAGGSLTVQDADGRFVLRAWLPWSP